MTEVGVIIVSYNTRSELEACLRALEAHPPGRSHEVTVVDNGSADGSPALVRAGWPGVRLIETGANLGFARAVNAGLRATESRLVLLLNSDAVLPAGALDQLTAVLDEDPTVTAVGPRLVDDEGRLEISFGPMLSPFNELWQKLLVVGHGRRFGPLSWMARRRAERRRDVDWVSGACLLARRAAVDAVGRLDERFFLYTEDVDLCASLRAQGGRVVYVPDVEVRHHRGRSRRHDPAGARTAYRRSHLAFYAKHHPRWRPLLKLYLRLRGELPTGDV